MKSVLVVALLLVAAAAQDNTNWPEQFDYFKCYEGDPVQRMPNTLDNLVALLEKYEMQQGVNNLDEMADMIITRYQKNGIVYFPTNGRDWIVWEEDKEEEKQELIDLITRPSEQLAPNSFEWREECGLHMLVSHSTDLYPHAGVNDLWDGTISRATRGDRNKRSLGSQPTPDKRTMSSQPTAANTATRNSQYPTTLAIHPLEVGVMETAYGPVAAGTLLTGLMAMRETGEQQIINLLSKSATDNMPQEMKTKTLSPVYAASLAGDLAQMALHDEGKQGNSAIGPSGRYHNCTTCARQFSLQNNQYSHLSRAELFAGLDVLIMHAAYTGDNGNAFANNLGLSQLLRMYYSEKGLPGNPQFKACNRMALYNLLDKTKLAEQALNFMYAYQNDFSTLKSHVTINKNDFPAVEQYFTGLLNPVMRAMDSFIGSYNYEDEGYARCSFSSGGATWPGQDPNYNNPSTGQGISPASEATVDLIAVYAQEGTNDNNRDQRQMIGDVARRLGVSTYRSRLGVLSAQDGMWVLPFGNLSNVGEFACNFTAGNNAFYPVGSGSRSSSKSDVILDTIAILDTHYAEQYALAYSDPECSSGRSLVVLWQVPSSMPGDSDDNVWALVKFRRKYPDVRFIFVGRQRTQYLPLLEDDDDFVSISSLDLPRVVNEAVARIQGSPKYFVFPVCDPDADSFNEASHVYDGAISPNFTTYIRIPPKNFHYSEELEIRISGGDVRTCFSRTNRLALEDYTVKNLDPDLDIQTGDDGDQLVCVGGPTDSEEEAVTFQHLCDRDVNTCNPVYISVTGQGGAKGQRSCSSGGSNSENICEYPNQITYQLSHKGMTCGSSSVAPVLLLLLLPAFLQYILQ